ncbi:MAG: response regulator [Legionellales bacterium]|jgi:DNA-binding response OmpR family regulator
METRKKRILVVDDDNRLCSLLSEYLTEQGFIVDTLNDTPVAQKYLAHKNIDLLILDRMLPTEDGIHFLARLRHVQPELPVIMLTARNTDIDRITGLELGADDYLAKPFNPRELLARIGAIFKRAERNLGALDMAPIQIGAYTFIPAQRLLKNDNEEIVLSTTEFAILQTLVSHPGQALSRDRLLTLAHGKNHVAFDRSIDTQISRLRKIIEPNPQQPRYIQTVWGTGYMFMSDEGKASE